MLLFYLKVVMSCFHSLTISVFHWLLRPVLLTPLLLSEFWLSDSEFFFSSESFFFFFFAREYLIVC